jgi:pimeloyl-ACP methyl ester carboxylesterase
MSEKKLWGVIAACILFWTDAGSVADDAMRLPRKSPAGADESYPGVEVRYDAIRDAVGHRLRLIVTHPHGSAIRYPTIFVTGWLSCDTVESPSGTTDATQLVLRSMAKLPGFATVRLEKAGVGDSEGDCSTTDFNQELAAYQLAFRRLKNYAFVDTRQVFILGISNGGGFAPLVPQGAFVKGYVVDGAWVKTWYEHMLEIERRRLALAGHSPAEVNALMKSVAALYSAYLLDRRSPQEIFEKRPELAGLWDGKPNQQYGRPVTYYQQLQNLNLVEAWSKVGVPVLALHGEFDWIMSRSDVEMIAWLVDHNAPGMADSKELPATGHTFEHYDSQAQAFAGKAQPFDDRVARLIGDWFLHHRL